MSKKTTKSAKSVTDEGVSSEFDLGNVPEPTAEMFASLDKELDEAGIRFEGDPEPPTPAAEPPAPAADEPPVSGEEPPVPAADEPPVSGEEPPSTDEQPPVPAAPEETPEQVEQRRVEELKSIDLDKVEAPAGVSPRNLVNFDKLREIAKIRTKEAETLKQRVTELESRQPESALVEQEKKELEELRTFRKIFDTENDPEFRRQFDEKITSVDDDLIAILKKNGLTETTENSIRELGVGNVSSKFWEQEILPRLPLIDQERVRRRLAERADMNDQRAREIEKFQSERGTFLQRQEEQQLQQFQQERDAIIKHVEDLRKDIPWAHKKEIPPKATKDEIAKIESHNRHVDELEFRFQDALYPANPQARAEIAAAAVASTVLAASVTDLSTRLQESNKRIQQLEAELNKTKAAGRIPIGDNGTRSRPTETGPTKFASDDDAIEAGLSAAESAL